MYRLSIALACAVAVTVSTTRVLAVDNTQQNTTAEFKVSPIGHVQKADSRTLIVLGKKYEPALLGLDGFSHIYVFWWFDRNDTPGKRSVLQVHPMGNRDNPLTGIFATRSPVRPNLLALTLCKIVAVKNNVIEIDKTDAFDGTPVLDIKPFIPGYDSAPDASVPDWLGKARKKCNVEGPGTDSVESLAAAMAKIGHAHNNLKLCQGAKWAAPENHPDLVPALQAFMVREGFHESRRNLAEGYDERFSVWLKKAEQAADDLSQAVLKGSLDSADMQFELLMKSCKQCHAEHRK